jgi:pimeloyl-ACP methyl ester carboxylesterase
MRRLLASLVALVAFGAVVSTASAAVAFHPCRTKRYAECARVEAPLDRTGRVPGRIGLHVERLPARVRSNGAVFALAGGPGQSSAPLLREFSLDIAPALRTRDLIAIDQRGTGSSGLLRCPDLERKATAGRADVAACAAALGPTRAFYTTLDAADDLEAVRSAIGIERVTLYGTSYGTKLALAYATRYPAHVERLLLDSVLPLDGPDPFTRDAFAAVPRVLRDLCRGRACRGITRDPVADLARLVAALRARPIRGRVVGIDGRPRARRLGRLRLLRILFDGDLDPSLRTEFPAAVVAALRGDDAPILRLAHRAAQFEGELDPPRLFSPALFLATSCEDGPLPRQPGASFSDRWGQAIARARGMPDAEFFPFDRDTGLGSDTLRLCASWPAASAQRAPAAGPLPPAPTLVLAGAADLRTPQEGAAAVARQIKGATLLVLPGTGHAALLNDLSLCALEAVERFFAGKPVSARCPRLGQAIRKLFSIIFQPTPVPPDSFRALRPERGVRGRPGRTVRAFELTLADAFFQELFATLGEAPLERAIGGLRAGRVRVDGRLDRYSFVPGVTVTDVGNRRRRRLSLLDVGPTRRFRVGGRAASRGRLAFDTRRFRIKGRVGGRRVRVGLGGIDASVTGRRAGGQDAVARLIAGLEAVRAARRPVPGYHCCPYLR